MAWEKVLPMDQRVSFICEYHQHILSFTNLCECYGVSRKTGYKWVGRYKEYGIDGLKERSRRPHHNIHRIPDDIRAELIKLRKQFGWGVSKLLNLLSKHKKEWKLPSYSTAHDILRQENLLAKKRRKRRVAIMRQPFAPVTRPNQLWSVDYKGQFKTRNGVYCYPLTVVDSHTRYLLACECVSGTTYHEAKEVFERLFKTFGMPERIRSDNGVPFASISIGGLSKLSIWWIKLGIVPERITPGRPQENGRHERMHRSLKAEAIRTSASNSAKQQLQFDVFLKRYNTVRPHESLGMKTPASQYHVSERKFTPPFLPMQYPEHYQVRLVNYNGCICWNNTYIYLSHLLRGENVGCMLLQADRYEIYFGPIRIGYFYEHALSKESCVNATRYGKV